MSSQPVHAQQRTCGIILSHADCSRRHTHVQVAGDLASASLVETRQDFTRLFTELLQNALLYATLWALDAFVNLALSLLLR